MIAGNPGPVELPATRIDDPRTGPALVRRFRGERMAVEALATTHRSAGARTEVTPDEGGTWATLLANYATDPSAPTDVPLTDIWEMDGNDLEKTLWEHPKIVAELAKARDDSYGIASNKLHRIKAEVEALMSGETETTDDDGQTYNLTPEHIVGLHVVNLGPGMRTDVWYKFLEALGRGVESWTISQYVLRHTTVIGGRSRIRPALDNVGKVFTTGRLKGAEAIPSTLMFDLPEGYWLKRTPSVRQTAPDKWTITQEWWHADAYDGFVYDLA